MPVGAINYAFIDTSQTDFMWVFGAGAFDRECAASFRHNDRVLILEVMKVGGGTFGRTYSGSWLYRVMSVARNRMVDNGQIDITGDFTHEDVASILIAQGYHETPIVIQECAGGTNHA